MGNTITFEMPVFDRLMVAMEAQSKELAEIKAILKIDKHDERDFVTANQFCIRNSISRKTLDKRVKEKKVEVDDSLGIKRYRKILP